MKQGYHGGNLKAAADLYGLAETAFLDFSANINPSGPSPKAWTALQEALDDIVHYPDPDAGELKAELASYLDVPDSRVLLGNGGVELIYLLTQFFQPKRIVLTAPTFGEYGQGIIAPEILRLDLKKEQGFQIQLSLFQEHLQQGDLIFIGNPNNPTGVLTSKKTVLALASLAAERGAILIVDEAFMDFVEDNQSVAKEIGKYPQLIVVGSLTKMFALPGLRLGYLVAAEAMINQLSILLPPWRINTLAQKAGLASLKDKEYLEASKNLIKIEKNTLQQGLEDIGFKVYQGAANFILVDARSLGIKASQLQQYVGPRGLLIRLCHSFYNLDKYFFRVAVRTREENIKMLKLLQEAIEGEIQ